jgi:hypothetical protein
MGHAVTSGAGVFWIGTSDAEIARSRALLRTLAEPGVLDELGFLVLLGVFSDRLYPAINTIMTRARYLVFVPAIMRHIEQARLARTRSADSLSRDFQYKLSQALLETEPGATGNIGGRTGRDVARPPSNVYWTALADLKIARYRLSEATYYEQLSTGRRSGSTATDDDGNVHESGTDDFWDPEFLTSDIVTREGNITPETSFRLHRSEARQLRDRYDSLRPEGGVSLLSHLLRLSEEYPHLPLDYDFPWAIPQLPGDLERIAGHARLLSLLNRGANLQYHALLFEKLRIADTGTGPAFEAWWAFASYELRSWNLSDLQALPFVLNGQKTGDVTFLSAWRDAICGKKSARSAFADSSARELLKQREHTVRGPKARLRSQFHLRLWRAPDRYKPDEHFGLAFRHRTALRFAQDIAEGLRVKKP